MQISVKNARAIGLTDTEICDLIQDQQAREAERKRNQRANVAGRPGRPGHENTATLTFFPNTESVQTREESKKERTAKSKSKHSLPDLNSWQPTEKHYDLGMRVRKLTREQVDNEADSYREQQANAKQPHRNPNMGFNRALREAWFSPRDGRHPNGNGRAKPGLLEVIDNTVDRQAAAEYVPGSEGPKPLALVGRPGPHGIRSLPKG